MQPDQKRHGPAALVRNEAAKHSTSGRDYITRKASIEPILLRLDRMRISALLRHHADYIDAILVMVCAGESISIAGRQALAYTADRLRQIAEALR